MSYAETKRDHDIHIQALYTEVNTKLALLKELRDNDLISKEDYIIGLKSLAEHVGINLK